MVIVVGPVPVPKPHVQVLLPGGRASKRGLAVQLLRAVARELQKTAEEADKDVLYACIFTFLLKQLPDRADEFKAGPIHPLAAS